MVSPSEESPEMTGAGNGNGILGVRAPCRNPTGNTGNSNNNILTSRRRSEENTDNDAAKRRRRAPCCDCTKFSTCSRQPAGRIAGCSCLAKNTPCVNCLCLTKCKNKYVSATDRRPNNNRGIAAFFGQGGNGDRTGAPPLNDTPQDLIPLQDGEDPEAAQTGAVIININNADNANAANADNAAADININNNETPDDTRAPAPPPPHHGNDAHPENPPVDAAAPEAAAPLPMPPADATIGLLPPDVGADLPGYVLTEADRLLDKVYGDHVHANPGTHLSGNFIEDANWQKRWKRIAQISPARYLVPQGRVGRGFLRRLTMEFRGVRQRTWNSERPLVFAAVILQEAHGIKRTKDIRAKMEARMGLWDRGEYRALVEDLEAETRLRGGNREGTDEERDFRAFNARVLSGRLRSACRALTNRNGGGVLQPDDVCTKTGLPVLEVLESKHPALRDPPSVGEVDGAFERYEETPAIVPVVISNDIVETVASRLSGAAGPGGTDAEDLKGWLLRYGTYSHALRDEFAALATWLANDHPPWASYRALMACRLVALDKQPGTRPVGIGEIYRRLMAKCLLKVTGHRATQSCGNFNLCAGLKAGIEGAVHVVRESWDSQQPPPGEAAAPLAAAPPDPPGMEDGTAPAAAGADPHGTLLVDARNGFNELGRKSMFWTVRHLWPTGSRFSFNCYRHAAQLVVRRKDAPCSLLYSREGVTQGDPLSMILYGLALVPLAESLRKAEPTVIQPWYADDAAMAGPVSRIATLMRLLEELGPARGYFPEPAKSIYLGRSEDEERAREVLEEFNFQYHEGHRYIGGFIGSEEARQAWLDPQIRQWVEGVKILAKAARKYPQTAYAGLVKSLQTEWTYLQRVAPDVEAAFAPVEKAIVEDFLPALLGDTMATAMDLRELSKFPIRLAGLGIPDPVASAEGHLRTSVEMTEAVSASLRDAQPLDAIGYGTAATRILHRTQVAKEKQLTDSLEPILDSATPAVARRLKRSKQTGAWLTALPHNLNGTVLSAEEFRDNLRLRCGLEPQHLPARCDGCSDRFTVEHALQCRKGGLILQRHDDLAGEWHQLCAEALKPCAVTDEPRIPNYQPAPVAGAPRGNNAPQELRGDVAVHGFWRRGTTAIFDIRVTDTDAASYRRKDPAKVLGDQEKAKKEKYGEACREAHRHFTPLVFSVDGLEGTEAKAARKRLASRLAAKWGRNYSQVCGFVRSRLAMALARSTSRCLRGTRDTRHRINQPLDWVAHAGIRLYIA